jgi:hypothetical protein
MIRLGVLLALATAIVAPAVARQASALSQAMPGLWELRKLPDGKPVRVCIPNVAMLAQVEHRDQRCEPKVVSVDGNSSVLRYSCPARGFGQSTVTVVTPRSLTIETQGISDGFPFNYVVNARRVGDCGAR